MDALVPRMRNACVLVPAICLVLGVGVLTVSAAENAGTGKDCYSEFWVINTRCAPTCHGLESGVDRIGYSRYVPGQGWQRASLEEFISTGTHLPTAFYAHGNGLAHDRAMSAGWSLYNEMRRCCDTFRFVLWSWPAQKATKGLVKDFRLKAYRAEHQGYYQSWIISQMPPRTAPISVSGHSLGGLTSAVSAHYLAGGVFAGRQLAHWPAPEQIDLRVAMISAAVDRDAMLPGYRYGASFESADRVLVFYNCKDRTLKLWPLVSPRGAEAISLYGMASPWRLGPNRHKLEQYSTTSQVGKQHRFKAYFSSPGIMAQLRDLYFGPPQPGAVAVDLANTSDQSADAVVGAVETTADAG